MLENLEKKASWEDFSHLAESIETVNMQTKLLASQISFICNHEKSTRASSHAKITKKLVNIVLNSKPILDESPSIHLKTFTKFPQATEMIKSRANTPKKKFFSSFLGA